LISIQICLFQLNLLYFMYDVTCGLQECKFATVELV
jgi:hypothetical protein